MYVLMLHPLYTVQEMYTTNHTFYTLHLICYTRSNTPFVEKIYIYLL